jgi:tetratricopeptide (TPR) repeat protein
VTLTNSRELFAEAKLSLDLGYEDLGVLLLEYLLEQLPGHVAAHCVLGQTYVALERWADAEEQFQYPLSVDPIHLSALAGMARVDVERAGSPQESAYARRLCDLYPYADESRELLGDSWDGSSALSAARVLTRAGRHEEALPYYESALASAPPEEEWREILGLLRGQARWMAGHMENARPVVEQLVQQQATWIRPLLILADIALQHRDDALGVALIHDATALDPSHGVALELLARDDRYAWLLEQAFELEVPSLETLDGAPNVLRHILAGEPLLAPAAAGKSTDGHREPISKQGRPSSKGSVEEAPAAPASEVVELVPSEEALEDRAPGVEPRAWSPVRVILTSRGRIIARYGEDGYRDLDGRVSELCEVTARCTGAECVKVHVDDTESLAEFGLSPVEPSDASQIAQLIRELDSRLRTEEREIVSLLILGGDGVIPFHRLANPADDEDQEVLSDWPYTVDEEGSLLSRFSVGRLPDSEPANLEALVGLVEQAIMHHQVSSAGGDRVSRSSWLSPVRRLLRAQQQRWSSVGFSAEIWAEASRSVFEVIGDATKLKVCPPLTDYDFLTTYERLPTLSYFNLHGFRGSPYWYGHGGSEFGTPLVPIALTPLSVSWASSEGAVVYSEACYGADLGLGCPEGSIALNLLAGGALGFVGSTAMSYGTLAPPLSGADLLGVYLWEGIVGGLPIGDALRRARAVFIQAATEGQGYLDGEDQKALMSFVLYGDPSLSLQGAPRLPGMEMELDVACPPLACCSRMMDAESLPLPKEVQQKVKRSLPFLQEDGLMAHPLILCRAACSESTCGTQTCDSHGDEPHEVSKLIQASQQHVVSKGGDQQRQVVKVTVNGDGDVVKVLVSRGGTTTHGGSR